MFLLISLAVINQIVWVFISPFLLKSMKAKANMEETDRERLP